MTMRNRNELAKQVQRIKFCPFCAGTNLKVLPIGQYDDSALVDCNSCWNTFHIEVSVPKKPQSNLTHPTQNKVE